MATPAFEEAIRLVLETRGAEGIEQLQAALADLGDVSDDTIADTRKLVESLIGLNEAAEGAARFDELTTELGKTETQLDAAERAAYQLALAMAEVEKPTRQMEQAQKAARAELEKQRDACAAQWQQLEKLEGELKAAGVNTSNLAAVQRELRNQIGSTAGAIDRQAQAVRNEAAAVQQLKQRMADGDEAFRKQATQSRAAAESLRAYRDRAAAAERETAKLGSASLISSRGLAKLSAVAAGLTGFISVRGAWEATKQMLQLGDSAEQTRLRLTRLYGEGAGDEAFDKIRRLARDSGQQFDALLQSALKLKTFGLEPLDGTLQGLIDQNALLGGDMEKLDGIILAVGQAWAKEKLQQEEVLQLMERGVPVLQLLSNATGKNTAELQRLSSAGALGRDVIRQLLDEMAKASQGAAAEGINGLLRLWARLVDNIQGFGRQVADSGALDYVKREFQGLLALFDRAAGDGSLERWAKKTSDLLVDVATAAKAGARFISQNADAIVMLGKAYAGFKIGQAIMAMNQWRVSVMAASRAQWANNAALLATNKSAGLLGTTLRSMPGAVKIAVALVGIEIAIRQAAELGEWLAKNSAAVREAQEAQRGMRFTMLEMAAGYAEAAKGLQQYHHQQVLNTEAAAELGDAERDSYAERLQGLKAYLVQLNGYYMAMDEAGALIPELAEQWRQVQARLAEVNKGLKDVATAADAAGRSLKAGIGASAQLVADQLKGIDGSAKGAAESIKKLFEEIDYSNSGQLANIALALAAVADQGAKADRNVRDGLLKTLQAMTGEELLRFQSAAQAAFDTLEQGAVKTSAILDQTLVAAMDKLGVSAERQGMRYTQMGRDATAAFSAILENANATSAQIETAFKATLSKVATLDEARALGAILEAAGQQGKLGFEQAARAADALKDRIGQITNAMDPLGDEFARLGITSQASLVAARDAAKNAFDAIRRGAAQGSASIEDVRRALRAYAAAARAAAADSDSTAKGQVESQLQLLEAIYRVNDALERGSSEGKDMGDGIKEGAESGIEGIEKLKNSLKDLAGDGEGGGGGVENVKTKFQELDETVEGSSDGIDEFGNKVSAAADFMNAAADGSNNMAFGIGAVSDAFMEAFYTMGQGLRPGANLLQIFADLLGVLEKQRAEISGMLEDLDKVAERYDENARRRNELREKYNFVGDAEIEAIIQKENQVKQLREQQAAERKRLADEEAAANAARLAAIKEQQAARELLQNGGQQDSGPQEFTVRVVADANGPVMAPVLDQLSQQIAPRLVRQIQKSQAVSQARRGR